MFAKLNTKHYELSFTGSHVLKASTLAITATTLAAITATRNVAAFYYGRCKFTVPSIFNLLCYGKFQPRCLEEDSFCCYV